MSKEFLINGRRLLPIDESARYLGLSPRTLYNVTSAKDKKNDIPMPKRIGRKLLWDAQDLRNYVDSLGN